MVMRKTTDTALIQILEEDLKPCQDAIRQIASAKWSMAHSKSRGTLLIRRRAGTKPYESAARDLESSLAGVSPELPRRLIWAWSSGGEERYFPAGELLVLFNEGTSEVERKKILAGIPGVKVYTYPDIEVKPPVRRAERRPPKRSGIPGFPGAGAEQALAALQEAQPREPVERSPEEPCELRVPVASITLPDFRRGEVFEIAAQIAALPGVSAVTPDFDVLGKRIKGEPQQWPIPPTSSGSVHERNLVDLAWALVDPSDLSAHAGEFLASREQVAVLDSRFLDHPDITYALRGYDAADQDRDPRTPDSGEPAHGSWMSGVIGGVGHGTQDEIGVAAGSVIVPVRPSWSTEDDFYEVDGQSFFSDYEEYVERFAANWVNAIVHLWQLSHSGLEVANMSIALNRQVWSDSGVPAWMNWWLRTGNFGYGVFAAASAGNNPAGTTIASPASTAGVFAVGWGRLTTGTMLGNTGPGLEVVGNDGLWPEYQENGQIAVAGGGGSSVASALVAATVAIIKSFNRLLTADDIKRILRLTTRKAPGQAGLEDGNGYCPGFGWGFLNAYHAIDVVWRDRHPAAELFRLDHRPGQGPRAMVQLRQWPWSPYADKRMGMFWVLTSQGAVGEQRWIHDRDPQLRHVDQAIDVWGLPFGELTLVADFDGDGLDEIALQLDADAFWPQFASDPAHSFLVHKHDTVSDSWRPLGGRSPYASGLASPQVIFPTTRPVSGVLAADLKGDGKQCLLSWQDNVVNALQFDVATNTFLRIDPVDFAPPVFSPAVQLATGPGFVRSQRILQAVRIGPVGGKDAVLCVATFGKTAGPGMLGHYLTVFVIAYDAPTSRWMTVPLSSDPADTHVLLDKVGTPAIEGALTGDFSATANPAHVQAVIHGSNDRLYYLCLHRDAPNAGFSGYAVYQEAVTLAGRVSRLRAGSFGIGGPPTQLAWLSDSAHGNQIRFLNWNDALRVWRDSGIVVSHGRKDNEAIDVAVAEGFRFSGVGGSHDVIALLMKSPDANTFKTYRWNSAAGQFEDIGVL